MRRASCSVCVRRASVVALAAAVVAGAACREARTGAPQPPAPASAAVPPAPAPSVPSSPPSSPRVIVVGGGLAGLVSAYELGKQGIATEILEASDGWGGRVATASYSGGAFAEYGMQEMWQDNPLIDIARQLGVPLDRAEQAYSSLVLDGKLVPYVRATQEKFFASFLDPAERRALAGFMDRARALNAQARVARAASAGGLPPELEELQSLSFADWIAKLALPRRVSEWIRLTLECELGTDWRGFSALAGVIELHFFLPPGQPNYHARDGNARLVDALVRAIPGRKTLLATVTAVERWKDPSGAPRARVSYLRNQRVETVEAERVILAVPFFRLHQIRMDPPLSAEKWQAVLTLGRGQYTVVHLLMDRDARKLWTVRGQSPFPVLTDGPLGVVYGVARDSPASQPLEVFSLLVHGAAAASFHMVPREVKLREILTKLDERWPGLSRHVRGSQVYAYHPAALPVWPPGRSPLDEGARALREPELGLYLAGDYTESAHSNGAAESGRRVAARIGQELSRPAPRPAGAEATPAATPATAGRLRSPPAPRPADRPAP